MAETSFEYRLERMFADTPTLADAELFAARVLERLDRGWMLRTLVIGSMGVLGGLVGVFEILQTGALGQLSAMSARASSLITQSQSSLGGLPVDFHEFIGIGVLAVVAAAFGVARFTRDI